jgi:hypothetical protein
MVSRLLILVLMPHFLMQLAFILGYIILFGILLSYPAQACLEVRPTVKSTMGFMGGQYGLLPSRTVMSYEVELLFGIKSKSFTIGTRVELTYISQFTPPSVAGGTDLGGRMYGLGPVIGFTIPDLTLILYFEPYRIYTLNSPQTSTEILGFHSPLCFGASFRFNTHSMFVIGLDFSYSSFLRMNSSSGESLGSLTYFNGGVSITLHVY